MNNLLVVKSKGNRNIRIGNFRDAEGTVFNPNIPSDTSHLTAIVESGTEWSDMPGTYSSVRLVVSNLVYETFVELSDRELPFIETRVDKFPEDVFWTLNDARDYWDQVLAEDGVSLVPDFRLNNRPFVIDYSAELLIPREVCESLISAGAKGFEGVSVHEQK